MRSTKHGSSGNNKYSNYSIGLDFFKPKEKARDRIEPMVLRSPPTGESLLHYALPLPSSRAMDSEEDEKEEEEEVEEDEILARKIARHLDKAITRLVELYGLGVDNEPIVEMIPEQEDIHGYEYAGTGMNTFLIYCSQFAAQLEDAIKEERNILDSLYKWFQQQVNQIEEISKDQAPEEKTSTQKISMAHTKLVKKLEDLRTRLKQEPRQLQELSVPVLSKMETENSMVKSYEAVKDKIEEFIKANVTKEFLDTSASESQTTYSMMNRLNVIIKMFENKSSMLERALNDQDLLQAKYKQIEGDLKRLTEEKSVLENELLKLKDAERKPTNKGDPTKKTGKTEKKKEKGKAEDSGG
ncbi:coiled-coil domain-containing protein 7-like isoform X2 [Dipodomys merriami]